MDIITCEILPDGRIKLETDGVSAPNHANAENLLREVARIAGGQVKRTLKPRHSLHAALHAHAADGHTHRALKGR